MTAAGRFPVAAGLTWVEVGGGLSGARVWRGDAADGPRLALKRLPDGYPAERLRQIHQWMRATTLAPAVQVADDGDTLVELDGAVWECLGWVPGEPLLGRKPTYDHGWALTACCERLAQLHRDWLPFAQPAAPPPCVIRRRSALTDAAPLLANPPPHLRPAADFLRLATPTALHTLNTLDRPGPVQPCLCDPRPDHFLFAGDRLTGVIDFAAMKPDHLAVDLARLLMETGGLAAGVAAYRAAGGSPAVTPELVQALADTGRVAAVAVWMLRLSHRQPTPAEADRLERLLAPLVHWT